MTTPRRLPDPYGPSSGANLADILERVLDKGIVIAGDIRINLLDIELLTIKLRLIVASVDKAKEMGIDWWESDPALSSKARRDELTRENTELRARLERLEASREAEQIEGARTRRREPEEVEGARTRRREPEQVEGTRTRRRKESS
ncbi:gas vesicle protein [Streptomyces sp. NPDC047009]|uniref:gas vesicle protein n=1 Tax=unclassified Streptomyces TaxID=2593676 RepID=UPI0033E5619B